MVVIFDRYKVVQDVSDIANVKREKWHFILSLQRVPRFLFPCLVSLHSLSYHPTHKLKYQQPTLTVSVYKIYLPPTYHSATQKLLKMRGFFLKFF
ncbi:unnamed protein product, partial [Vitis vinifera]|uniref:Uncharacterized protein n=1 Tax=Vitis vinifera TaxID=29760 RepID=E0CQ77_VITVI